MTEKILLALAEYGDVTQKMYGMRMHTVIFSCIMINMRICRQSYIIRGELEYTGRAPRTNDQSSRR